MTYILILMALSSGFYGGAHTIATQEFGNETACRAAAAAAVEMGGKSIAWRCVKKA